ncbi:DUF6059 family protein, partial [Streptomyces clavuligerus]
MTTIPGAGFGPRAVRRAGRFLVRGLASLAAMFGVLPAEHFRAAAREWSGRSTPPVRPAPDPAPAPRSEPWAVPRGGPWDDDGGGLLFPWGLPRVGGAVLPLDEPPPAHPERLVPHHPPAPGERELWAQLEDPF